MLMCGMAALQWTGCARLEPVTGKDMHPPQKKRTLLLFQSLASGPLGGVTTGNSTANGAPGGNGQLKCSAIGQPARTQWFWYAGAVPTNPTWREVTFGPKNLPAGLPWRVRLRVDPPARLVIDDVDTPLTVGKLCTVWINYR